MVLTVALPVPQAALVVAPVEADAVAQGVECELVGEALAAEHCVGVGEAVEGPVLDVVDGAGHVLGGRGCAVVDVLLHLGVWAVVCNVCGKGLLHDARLEGRAWLGVVDHDALLAGDDAEGHVGRVDWTVGLVNVIAVVLRAADARDGTDCEEREQAQQSKHDVPC